MPKLERLKISFPDFGPSLKPTKAIVEIDAVDPEALQEVLRTLREYTHPSKE